MTESTTSALLEETIPDTRLVVRQATKGFLPIFALGLLMIGAPAWMAWVQPNLVTWALAAVAVTFFGGCIFGRLWQIVSGKPALVASSEGLYENSSPISVGFLEWDEIERVSRYEFGNESYLAIELRDPATVIARQSFPVRKFHEWTRSMGFPIANVIQSAVTMPLEEIETVLRDRYGVAAGKAPRRRRAASVPRKERKEKPKKRGRGYGETFTGTRLESPLELFLYASLCISAFVGFLILLYPGYTGGLIQHLTRPLGWTSLETTLAVCAATTAVCVAGLLRIR